MAAHQTLLVVEFGAGEQIETGGIDQHPRPVLGEDQIIGRRRAIDIETVLEAAAPAGEHRDAQRRPGRRLGGEDRGDAGAGAGGQAEAGGGFAHARNMVPHRRGLKGEWRDAKARAMSRAPYAVQPGSSRGRLHAEPEAATRSPFQRDRDRVIHSAAFRKLQYKTQVFVNHEGDFYRTRLTHSLEVAQVARSVARELGLDEDLTEALALAHDLGHPPFGHAGEAGLAEAAAGFGGFDHNAQSLRVVTLLESRYAGFDGLNLTWETLEGLAKHNGPLADPPAYIRAYDARHPLDLSRQPSAEAQVAAVADDIAYTGHDLDDGLRAGLSGIGEIGALPLAGDALAAARALGEGLAPSRLRHETVRRVIDFLITDLVAETRRRIAALAPRSAEAIRAAPGPVVGFAAETAAALGEIRRFLHARMYRHWRVARMVRKTRLVAAELFTLLHAEPGLLPEEWAWAAADRAETVTDYVAGMTDRFALDEHRRLTDPAATG